MTEFRPPKRNATAFSVLLAFKSKKITVNSSKYDGKLWWTKRNEPNEYPDPIVRSIF